jgi:hypothetical protein
MLLCKVQILISTWSCQENNGKFLGSFAFPELDNEFENIFDEYDEARKDPDWILYDRTVRARIAKLEFEYAVVLRGDTLLAD